MDLELLVDDRIEDGKALLEELSEDRFDVTVAFWAKADDGGRWSLYIGSAAVRSVSIADAYRELYAALRRLPDARLSLSDIKILDPDDPVARDAIRARDRVPGRLPKRYRGERLGDLAIEEAYIYPRPGTMTRLEIVQTVAGLIDRAGAAAPSLVTLRDGTQFQGMPVALNINKTGPGEVVFHDVATSRDRPIPVDEVVGIR
jgi:hypothetical protein